MPALAAIALFVLWATDQAGYPVTHWAPGAILLLVLLAIALGVVRLRLAEIPMPIRIALGALAAYTALSFLSILWAKVPGDAWEGANRTLLYLLVFALFACWRQRGASAALLLCLWALALIVLAGFAALHVEAARGGALQSLIPDGRLVYPTDYANANAAQWLMAFWPAFILASSDRLPWGLRGLLAGGAVLLAEVALLSQSRGSLYATPVMLILVFALLPWRARLFATLLPIAAGIGAAAPAVLRIGNDLQGEEVLHSKVHSATVAMFVAALIVGLVVAAGAAIEQRRAFSDVSIRRTRRGVGAIGIATLVVVIVGGLIVSGNPLARVRHAWDTFKSPAGYAANSSGSRLTGGLGSQRYDFYRVALDEFVAHPLLGIGADNFQQQYLARGHTEETPHYPHSVELRTLAETGLLGTIFALLGLLAALWAGLRACRSALARRVDPLGAYVAAAALSAFAYWLVHGSFDWFFEFAGLGAPAFALLGLGCGLMPGRAPADAEVLAPDSLELAGSHHRLSTRALLPLAGILLALVATLSLAAPWLSELEVENAAGIWTRAPLTAYGRLREAARLNPLSDEPYLVAGSIALRYGDLERAEHEFALALGRSPNDAYATLEQGAIASARGDRARALRLLERAHRLNPHEQLTRQALQLEREGRLNIEELNRSILVKAHQLA